MKTFLSLCLFLFVTGQVAYGQTNKEIALEKGREAIKLMDDGKLDESIVLLKQAQVLDPDKFDYPYEMAYAYYSKEDYKEAIRILEENMRHKDVIPQLYQLLGNSYDISGKTEKAFEIYDAGLKKFPNSGMIYLEKGNVYLGKKEYDKAIALYEKGIELDPKFPSNYYRAALMYCNSTTEVWGLIYGEIFMNLERNSKRTAEISKLLFDTYKNEIKFTSDTSLSVSFCDNIIDAGSLADPAKFKMPFCLIYEPTLMMSIIMVKNIDIHSLNKIREGFVKNYFKMGHNKTHPNILFEYQDQILKAGHMEAYNHWLLMKGDEDGFDKWLPQNKEKWESFKKWFADNKLKVDLSNRFYKAQY